MSKRTIRAAAGAPGGDRVLVLDKAFSVLDLLAQSDDGLRAADLQRRLEMPRPTLHRILGMLVEHGYVARGDDDRYRLGLRLYELGKRVQSTSSVLEMITGELTRIADDLDVTAYLSVRRNDHAMCLARIDRGPVRIADYQVGETLPLTIGGGPKVLLATMTDTEIDQLLDRQRLAVFTDTTLSSRLDVWDAITAIRRDGYAIGNGDHVEIQTAVGVPLADGAGAAAGAISIAMIQPRPRDGELETIVARLRLAAMRLSGMNWHAAELVR